MTCDRDRAVSLASMFPGGLGNLEISSCSAQSQSTLCQMEFVSQWGMLLFSWKASFFFSYGEHRADVTYQAFLFICPKDILPGAL